MTDFVLPFVMSGCKCLRLSGIFTKLSGSNMESIFKRY